MLHIKQKQTPLFALQKPLIYSNKKMKDVTSLLAGFGHLLTHLTRLHISSYQKFGLRHTLQSSRKSVWQKAPSHGNLNIKLVWHKWKALHFLILELSYLKTCVLPITSIDLQLHANAIAWSTATMNKSLWFLSLEVLPKNLAKFSNTDNICTVIINDKAWKEPTYFKNYPTIGINCDFLLNDFWFGFLTFNKDSLLEYFLLTSIFTTNSRI